MSAGGRGAGQAEGETGETGVEEGASDSDSDSDLDSDSDFDSSEISAFFWETAAFFVLAAAAFLSFGAAAFFFPFGLGGRRKEVNGSVSYTHTRARHLIVKGAEECECVYDSKLTPLCCIIVSFVAVVVRNQAFGIPRRFVLLLLLLLLLSLDSVIGTACTRTNIHRYFRGAAIKRDVVCTTVCRRIQHTVLTSY